MENNLKRVRFYIPIDIIFYILTSLHIKTLIRIKSVCKTWYELIENPSFVEAHQNNQPNLGLDPTLSMLVTTAGLTNTNKYRLWHLSEGSHKPIDSKLPYLSNTQSYEVVGICDGLVCLSLSDYYLKLIVCNPTTRQFRKIPSLHNLKETLGHVYLGFSLDANGYTIIRIFFISCWGKLFVRVELYTKCTNTWRKIKVKLGKGVRFLGWNKRYFIQPVVVNGIFYWEDGDYITSFDMHKNKFDGKNIGVFGGKNWRLQKMKEELALILYHCNYMSFDIWMRNENRNWKRIYAIDFRDLPTYPKNWGGSLRVLGCTRNGELIIISKNSSEDNLTLLLYDLISCKTKRLHSVDVESAVDHAYLYTKSLTPVN